MNTPTISQDLVKSLLRPNPNVVVSSQGINAWGVYAEQIRQPASFASPTHYTKLFLAGNTVLTYHRRSLASRTVWRRRDFPSHWAAKAAFSTTLTRLDHHLRGSLILVQLEPVDIAQLKTKDQLPGARYRGNARHEKLYGKFPAVAASLVLSSKGLDAMKTAILTDSKLRTIAEPY